MKYWEFLIQKEGDETWLPLETQQVEILEGRYRVVAHTDRKDVPVEIRVSQLITEEMPPRRRVRKRTSTISDAGLVVVMPFVHLKPGQWDLKCSGADAIGDVIGEQWEYSVELQVFAHTDEDWSAEWPVPEDDGSVATSLVENEAAVDSLNSLPLAQAQAELQENQQRQGNADASDSQLTDAVYSIYLKQQAFLARRNQPMTIMGQVQNRAGIPQGDAVSQLWLRLQNPKTAQVIMEAHRPLSLERLPADFKVKIQLPANVTTRVVLGEVSLRTAAIDPGDKPKVLSATAFTITAGIAQLLDDLANQDAGVFDEETSTFPGMTDPSEETSDFDSSLSAPLLDPTYKEPMPAVGVVLPPKLNQNSQDFAARNGQRPELPTFPAAANPLIVSDPYVSEDAPVPGNSPLSGVASEPENFEAGDVAPENFDAGDLPPAALQDEAPQERSLQDTVDAIAADVLPPQPISRPPMVSQPAQFMGTSIEDDDLETEQIAALLEDIDSNLASEVPGIDDLEAPGVAGVLPDLDSARQSVNGLTHRTPLGDVVPSDTVDSIHRPSHQTSHQTSSLTEDDSKAQPLAGQPTADKPDNRFQRQSQRKAQQQAQKQAWQEEASSAFKSLKLKDHFWNRLTNLTHESRQEAAQLSKDMKAAGVTPNRPAPPPLPPLDLSDNSEVVIYDQPPAAANAPAAPRVTSSSAPAAPLSPASISSSAVPASPVSTPQTPAPLPSAADTAAAYSANYSSRQARRQTQSADPSAARPLGAASSISPEDLPEMALPVISVPVGDLVAGESITITVRTRPSVYKPFIKLWMIDRQSRTLVGEPKLLTNLRTDALGDLETTADLQVPMGCLDVQIAAIAVDMATQQESNKAVVNRHVIPANQRSTSTRGFNF